MDMYPTQLLPDFQGQQCCSPVLFAPSPPSPSPPTTFHEYIQHKLPSQQTLFQQMRFFLSDTQLHEQLHNHPSALLVTDGGCKHGKGSFGWKFAINSIIVAEGCGPAEGSPHLMSSFRAEGYGLYIASVLALCAMHYFELQTSFQWNFHFDNQSMIDRQDLHQKTITPMFFPLASDYDVTLLIHQNLSQLSHTLNHVKGHQDDKKPLSSLTFVERLNVLADQLATAQLNKMKVPSITVTLPQHAHLIINHNFITSRVVNELREAAKAQHHIPFLRQKYHWSLQTFNDIDWDVHYKALQAFSLHDQRTLIKFNSGWLPTGKHRHRETKGTYPKHCLLCQHELETQQHLLCCNHPDQVHIWEQLIADLATTQTNLKSDDHMTYLLTHAIKQSLLYKQWQPIPAQEPSAIHSAINKQNHIGWKHILHGQLSKSIIKFQEQHYQQHNLYNGKDYKGQCWATQFLITLWKRVLEMWKSRCRIVHGRDQQEKQNHAQQIFQTRVQRCYDYLPNLTAMDRHIFDSMATATLQKTPRQIEHWLSLVEPLIQKDKLHKKQQQQHKPFEAYFTEPSYNIHVREINQKPKRNQDIRRFFLPSGHQ